MISAVTEKRDCAREWVKLSEAMPYQREKGSYQGTVYMLVNSDTASAGETAVLYGRSLRNFVLIGENQWDVIPLGMWRAISWRILRLHAVSPM